MRVEYLKKLLKRQGVRNVHGAQIESRSEAWPKVAIVVLNWNGWRDTVECLESLQKLSYPNYRVILVDNGSIDDSVNQILGWCAGKVVVRSKFFEYDPANKPVNWIEYDRLIAEMGGVPEEEEKVFRDLPPGRCLILIRNEDNLGFAEGNNVGIRYALANGYDYICLVNNDTVVSPDFLRFLVERADGDSSLGILGGKIYRYDEPSVLWYAGGVVSLFGRGPGYVIKRSETNEFSYVSFVSGCLMFLRAELLRNVGLLDSYFFFGAEDADICLRAIRSGFRIGIEPRAVIWHKVARTYDKYSQQHIYYVYRGKIAFTKKHLHFLVWWLWISFFVLYLLLVVPQRQFFRTKSLKVVANTITGGLKALRDGVKRSGKTNIWQGYGKI